MKDYLVEPLSCGMDIVWCVFIEDTSGEYHLIATYPTKKEAQRQLRHL